MHTFFINTSKKELNGYDVLFDIHRESKSLVSMDCLMPEWYDAEKGYTSCVKKMSDMIEGYTELNNAFNLIVYIDLLEYKAYSSIERDEFHDGEREVCCAAMQILFTHVVRESLLKELSDSGRMPNNVLLMFGQEKAFAPYSVAHNDPRRAQIMKKLLEFIGLPEQSAIEGVAKKVDASGVEDKLSAFMKEAEPYFGEELILGLRDGYRSTIRLWLDEVINEQRVDQANDALFDRIANINRTESVRLGIESVFCPYDYYACRVNKSVQALSELNIALYLLKCVELNSVYEEKNGMRSLVEFRQYKVDEIAPILKSKKDTYDEKVEEVEALAKSYSELGLAPRLRAFDHEKFGLDVYGDRATEIVVEDAAPKKKGKATDDDGDEEGDDGNVVIVGNEKETDIVQKCGRALFSKDEYTPFDYNYEDGRARVLKKKTTPEQYVEQAKKVRKHHIDYLKKLKIHVSHVLSNYAGKSKQNKPALLQIGGYRYAAVGEENRVLEAVESVSDKAYRTMVDQYMEFCAGRSVAISDIEEQCNWFITRVYQIKESLRKLKLVAVGLLLAIIALYIPFFVIQFEAITENTLTLVTALGSFAVPLVLLYMIFAIISAAQKRRFGEAWNDFIQKSDEALEENRLAVQKYDQLLSTVVPALRWVYEYKLDVDYCVECCGVADAKIEHHRRKLRDRVTAIKNILSDLEYTDYGREASDYGTKAVTDSVDYNVSFCTGKKNRAFYSVIGCKDLTRAEN